MRGVSMRVQKGAALFALLLALAAPTLSADEPGPFDPPEARIRPPIGVTSADEPSLWEEFLLWVELMARIRPPIG
jgi:hypothetical protein